jgi:hypothetical protein
MTLMSKEESSKGDVEYSSGDSTSSNKGHEAAKDTRITRRKETQTETQTKILE